MKKLINSLVPVGTRSLLWGCHCFFIHPFYVYKAWKSLYGGGVGVRLWMAFLIHDWGYWGLPRMDDEEGERHVEWAAALLHRLFDRREISTIDVDHLKATNSFAESAIESLLEAGWTFDYIDGKSYLSGWKRVEGWKNFSLFHSRFYAEKEGMPISRLCVADKLAMCLEPKWLYLFRAKLSGEIDEYIDHSKDGKYAGQNLDTQNYDQWYDSMVSFIRLWVIENKDKAVVYGEGE